MLGGGLAEAGEALLAPLRAALRERITFHREPQLVRAALGDEAGCLGAALLALDAWSVTHEGRAAGSSRPTGVVDGLRRGRRATGSPRSAE